MLFMNYQIGYGSANSVGQMREHVRQFLVVHYFDVCCVFLCVVSFFFYFLVYFYSALVANKLHIKHQNLLTALICRGVFL